MAQMTCHFFSDVLQKHTGMTVIIPEQTSNQYGGVNKDQQAKLPLLYLLHGFSDDHTIWSRRTSIERYADEHGIAVVMPDGDHSFYTDMHQGRNYFTFLSEELPKKVAYLFPVSMEPKDTYVAGLSMGGYGALKWALSRPDAFHKVASLSGAVDMARLRQERETGDMGPLMDRIFADKDITDTTHDLFYLLKQLINNKKDVPDIYLACGTEDFLYEDNQRLAEQLTAYDLRSKVTFDSGTHEWGYWDRHIKEVLDWMMK
ncbi:tributyrin esterase [Halolactibacillus miurensis]|uniref:S-formylglutathione hydrolase FrmB n=1 Tax=Halolactibacillus miurensis TaxID=306541 RepID=A0A1I6R3I1_9BACI|nr:MULTISPECIES: alpha/beta hydrolase family protein [Halolactibacillus]GEM03610.1 tributyrin esterase [Halolactibacillus miurensis]SFS59184.1 S-formylglutathione hydrolase FrmB [Halolactibacillus miurensis]